ncbi:polymorphic toxin type 33 domain-containing protein [Chryseobacterium antibioticum]|uniref:Polymorphic toxin type 33 domain-containing protein n=1 Tax=Chryseobacterium pyrolae TaxID=2987481 RepID=A0ABT2ICS0_9FLAO|nr:polymorphic toxin type 33 domain-containing protein [Chryseobacterium pyrolae]MCT2406422.1 polymorphic toxin type 33 domain-containing protein [Chryseobacterium pyrolae]
MATTMAAILFSLKKGKLDTKGLVLLGAKNNFKILTANLLKKAGIDAHELKYEFLGKKAKISEYDLYKHTDTNEVLILKKGGKGDPIHTGEYIK